jgi:phosphopantetheinyl transferase (holo-ACP synthase)
MACGLSRAAQAGEKAGIGLNTGVDLVCVGDVGASLRHFGEAYVKRLLSDVEQSTLSTSAALRARQCALMFAGKEAALKALLLADQGVDWRDIVVNIQGMKIVSIGLRGRASELVAGFGVNHWQASGQVSEAYAMAMVLAD